MNFEDENKMIQKKIDWISSQIRETKIQLKRQYKELEDALKEQEKLRKKKKKVSLATKETVVHPSGIGMNLEHLKKHVFVLQEVVLPRFL